MVILVPLRICGALHETKSKKLNIFKFINKDILKRSPFKMDLIKKIEQEHMRLDLISFKAGDNIKVYYRIVEGEKERIQVFQGNVIRINRGTTGATFTIRKISDGVGVERIIPLHSPFIDRIEMVTEGDVRRSRLYYLRKLKGKAARIKPKSRFR